MADIRKSWPDFRADSNLGGSFALIRRNTIAFIRRNTFGCDKSEYDPDVKTHKMTAGVTLDFIGLMLVTQLLMKWVLTMNEAGTPFLFMGYHIPAPTMQVYSAIVALPGALKPLLGLISDAFPIFGYTKSPYAILLSITGLVGMFALGTSPANPMSLGLKAFLTMEFTKPSFSIALVILALCFVNLMHAMNEVFTAGLLAEKINNLMDSTSDESIEDEATKKNAFNMIGVWVVMGMLASIGAHFACGRVLTDSGAPTLFLIGGFMALSLPLWVVFRGFGEQKLTEEKLANVRAFLARQKEIVGLTILLAVMCLLMLFLPMAGGNGTMLNFIIAIVASATVIIAFVVLLTPVVARMFLCFFIFGAFNINTMGAFQYFCIDNKYQFPGGPNFSKMFMTFWIPLASTLGGLLGCVLFRAFGVSFRFRQWEILVSLLSAPAMFFNIAWAYRWNISWGISDGVWSIISFTTQVFFIALQVMPFTFAVPRMCPYGLESSMMQLLSGAIFMGQIVAEDFGALLLQWYEVEPSGAFFEQDQFDNLGEVMLVKSVIGWVVCFLSLWLLPTLPITADLIQNGKEDAATEGSIWKKYFAKHPPSA